ncbi:MAG: response regulator [Campylobacterales bacterium]|nr:response regulator [Campylobacterales bacterium]
MTTPILIVEDESIVAMEMAQTLTQEGYHVVAVAANGHDAYIQALRYQPHVILMDINIKGEDDGIKTAQSIVSQLHTTIIYLTAFNDDATVERAITTAPAAYLNKPYRRDDLLTAVKIALMHYDNKLETLHVRRGNLVLDDAFSFDTLSKELFCYSQAIHLTSRERELLELLINARRRIVTIYDLENTLWPDKPPMESTRRALISRLRTKLRQQFIETIVGIGYRFVY